MNTVCKPQIQVIIESENKFWLRHIEAKSSTF